MQHVAKQSPASRGPNACVSTSGSNLGFPSRMATSTMRDDILCRAARMVVSIGTNHPVLVLTSCLPSHVKARSLRRGRGGGAVRGSSPGWATSPFLATEIFGSSSRSPETVVANT
jgi:hypothetical protein